MSSDNVHNRIIAARRDLIASISENDSARSLLVRLANALLHENSPDPSIIAEVEELLAFSNDPDVARGGLDWPRQAQTILGFMYRGIGRLEEACIAFAKAYNWRPDILQSAELLADVYRRIGREEDADAVMTEHLAIISEAIALLPVWEQPASRSSPVTLYLDLLEKVVCNWIYGDNSHPSSGSTSFDVCRREVGRDLPVVAHSMIGRKRLHHLRWAVETVLLEGVPGDFIEAGAWRGGACILMRGVLAAHGVSDRKVYVADSFSGLPAPDPRFDKDMATLFDFDRRPELAVGLDDVKRNFEAYDLLDEQVEFVAGWFKDSLPYLEAKDIAILRLDGDLYASTIDTLDILYDKVSNNGFVICDDYGVVIDAQRAVLDFRRKRKITTPMFAIDGDGVFWRKQEVRIDGSDVLNEERPAVSMRKTPQPDTSVVRGKRRPNSKRKQVNAGE